MTILKTSLGVINILILLLINISIKNVKLKAPNITGKDKIKAIMTESLLFILSNLDPIKTDAALLVPGIKDRH
jgi:hypothetical protein